MSRFTRLRNYEDSSKAILIANNICVDTIKDGYIDFSTEEGEFKDFLLSTQNRKYSLNISKDSLRGRNNLLLQGWWPSGRIPIGYNKEYHSQDGTKEIVNRKRKYSKGRNTRLKLVINESEAKVIKTIFTRLKNEGISYRQLALELNQARAANLNWTGDIIKEIITQPAYTGKINFGIRRKSKREAFNRAEANIIDNACPVIIEDDLYQEVNAIMQKRRESGSKPQTVKAGLLSGFLICKKCNYKMEKKLIRGKVHYTCSSANKRKHLGCKQWRVIEATMVPKLLEWLLKEVDIELLKKAQVQAPQKKLDEESLLKELIKDLEEKVKTGKSNAMKAPAEFAEEAWELVSNWNKQLTKHKQDLELMQSEDDQKLLDECNQYWEALKPTLINVRAKFAEEFPDGSLGKPHLIEEFDNKDLYNRENITLVRVEEPLTFDSKGLRMLLEKLNLKMVCDWVFNPTARLISRKAFEWELQPVEISIDLRAGVTASITIQRQRVFTISGRIK